MKILKLAVWSLFLPLSSLLADITGTYHVHGGNSTDNTSYTGVLVIEKTGQVFTASWTLSDGSSTGTGVRKGNHLAIEFEGVNSVNQPLIGVQLYEIDGNTLEGPWAISGEISRGFEVAKKTKDSSSSR